MVLMLQQPVAGDLRILVSALRIVTELERIGDLAAHVAKIARMRAPDLAVPAGRGPGMAQVAAGHRHIYRPTPGRCPSVDAYDQLLPSRLHRHRSVRQGDLRIPGLTPTAVPLLLRPFLGW